MKAIIFLFLFFSYSAFASIDATKQVEFIKAENLPPIEEMAGMVISENETIDDRGEEIQLASHPHRRRHGRRGHHSPPWWHPPHYPMPVPPPPPVFWGNVCRQGVFYCYMIYANAVGTPCQCYGAYGYIWLYGNVSFN